MNGVQAIVVRLDGRPHSMPLGSTLADLISTLGGPPEAVATAVNDLFVPRAQRGGHLLQPGDSVLLFQPIVGG